MSQQIAKALKNVPNVDTEELTEIPYRYMTRWLHTVRMKRVDKKDEKTSTAAFKNGASTKHSRWRP